MECIASATSAPALLDRSLGQARGEPDSTAQADGVARNDDDDDDDDDGSLALDGLEDALLEEPPAPAEPAARIPLPSLPPNAAASAAADEPPGHHQEPGPPDAGSARASPLPFKHLRAVHVGMLPSHSSWRAASQQSTPSHSVRMATASSLAMHEMLLEEAEAAEQSLLVGERRRQTHHRSAQSKRGAHAASQGPVGRGARIAAACAVALPHQVPAGTRPRPWTRWMRCWWAPGWTGPPRDAPTPQVRS